MNMTCTESGEWDRFVRCRFEGIILKIQKHLHDCQTKNSAVKKLLLEILPIFDEFLFKMIERSIFT